MFFGFGFFSFMGFSFDFFKRNLGVVVEKWRICVLSVLQFKANLYSCIFFDFIMLFVYLFFFRVLFGFVVDVVVWRELEFLVYYFAMLISAKMKYLFSLFYFSSRLVGGGLNVVLTKPISPYLYENLLDVGGVTILTLPFVFLAFLGLCWFLEYSWLFVFFGLLVLVLGFFLEFLCINFIESLAFFFKRVGVWRGVFLRIIFFNEKFTPKLLENFSKGFYFVSTSIYGFFVIEVLNGRVELFLWVLPWVLGICVILVATIKLLWVYGLKYYEGFG